MDAAFDDASTDDDNYMIVDDFDASMSGDELPPIEDINKKITDAQAESRIEVVNNHYENFCALAKEVVQILDPQLHFFEKIIS